MQMRALLSSPRRRRRLAWVGVAVLVAAMVAAVALILGREVPAESTRPGGRLVSEPAQVPVSAADRAQIDSLLDRFVPAAVARRDPLRAYDLTTPQLRAVATRAEWRRGQIPVPPFPARGPTFHHWLTRYSYRDEVNFNLELLPPKGSAIEPLGVNFDVRRVGGRWLVDSVVAERTYAPTERPAETVAQPEIPLAAPPAPDYDKPRLGAVWFLVPALIFGLPLLALTVLGARGVVARRRAERAYASERRPR